MALVAYDVQARRRIAFGTSGAPDVTVADAVAASSAIPFVFNPHEIRGRSYVDGGVASGTHADLVLGSRLALDLLIVVPPLAQPRRRKGAMFYEPLFDRVGVQSLKAELELDSDSWPETEILALRPPTPTGRTRCHATQPHGRQRSRANLHQDACRMHDELARPDVWKILERTSATALEAASANRTDPRDTRPVASG